MKLWSIHPRHLDAQGLVALWRDPRRCEELLSIKEIEPHPMFEVIEGKIEDWEKAASA